MEAARITVSVPREGLRRYSFQGLGYEHNRIVADRRAGWPASRGVPLPRGAVRDAEALRLTDAAGQAVPRQVRPLAQWPDGSVMFALVQWQADVAHDAPADFTLELAGGEASPRPAHPVLVREQAERIELDNGPLHVVIGRETDGLPTLEMQRGAQTLCRGPIDLWTCREDGRRFQGVVDSLRVVESGPLVGVVEITGRHVDAQGLVFLHFELQLRLDSGRDELELVHTFLNLGDEPDGVVVGEIGFRLPALAGVHHHVLCQNASGQKSWQRIAEQPENAIVNLTATGARVHDVDLLREDTTGYPSYLMNNRDIVFPWIGIRGPGYAALTCFLEGPQNWPKRLAVEDGALTFGLWPANYPIQELRQGMARHHHMKVCFFAEETSGTEFQRVYHQLDSPATEAVDFAWYQHCRVFGMEHVLPWMPARYPKVETALLHCPERGWASGMLGYGDDPNSGYDYSFIGFAKDTIWINNEHDYTAQAATHFWRSGRPAGLRGLRVAAEHQIDVDFVRKSDDPWKVGGIPAHCARHTTASVYPSHTWTEGLLQYFVTSGDPRALEVAQSLGRNLCKYVEEFLDVLGIESRMPGWALIALTALIEVTRDARCLRAARRLRDYIGQAVDADGTYDPAGMNYGTGTVLTGLGHLHRLTGDTEALRLLCTILDWHMAHGRNAVGIAWAVDLDPYKLNLTLPAYAYAYYATGEEKYREEGLRFLRYTGPPEPLGDIRGGAKQYRTYLPILQLAHEAGMLDEFER